MKYRAEIDGLRAIAVLPVILFHSGLSLFSGGYVGVDIFFVISGYLITAILIDDFENKNFKIINFYENRAKRLLPALFFVMLTCIPFAWLWMLPNELENFGQSLVATSWFANNFLLIFTDSNYWSLSAEFKPLLHTWSLAVEEQFYLFFPIILFIFLPLGRKFFFGTIILLAILSFLSADHTLYANKTTSFYLITSRAWELLAGSICAFIVLFKGTRQNNILSIIGLISVIAPIFIYNQNTPFPGIYTLVPVLGTVLLILFSNNKTLVNRILRLRPLIGVGLISYSLYLWHQPLISFSKIYFQEPLDGFGLFLLLIIIFLLSYLTWHFIEKPFRYSYRFKQSIFFMSSISIMLMISIIGFYFNSTNGSPDRMFEGSNFQRSIQEIKIKNLEPRINLQELLKNNVVDNNLLIIGDSFADDIAYLIVHKYPELSPLILSNPESFLRNENLSQAVICNQDFLDKLSLSNIRSVIFSFDEGYEISCMNKIFENSDLDKIDFLFVGVKQFGYNLNWLSRKSSEERINKCQKPLRKKLLIDQKDSENIPSENYFSFFEKFSKNQCFPITNNKGELLSSDRNHFTIAGVEFFSEPFLMDENLIRIIDNIKS